MEFISRRTWVYGTVRPVYLFFAVLLLFAPLRPVFAEEDYLESLIRTAHEQHLCEDRSWQVLLHYKPHGSGWKSLIDDPRFFLAPDGKVNPQAELDATLKGFFGEEKKGEEHPRCRFVARYVWLKEKLGIDETKLPPAACTEFKEALGRVKPHSAVLVFPTTLNNSPASMFGHTLIRIDSEKQSGLLSYAVTYGATNIDSNGFLYAFKGIFGYYPGYFNILPYYEKVAEYSNIEHRDIWEYQLNLTEEEVRMLVLHVWEIRDVYSDYYFFDENCSFDLLLLLEAARPSLHLSDVFWDSRFHFWVIPVDTIRVIKASGLVTAETFRPSQARRITAIADRMNPEERQTAVDLSNRKMAPRDVLAMQIAPEEKMKILDLSAELLQYQYASKKIAKEDYLKQFLPVLNARSSLGMQTPDSYAIMPPGQPENGHLPGKLSAGGGYRTNSFFTDLGWRAAYHDLLDPDAGYTEGAQIDFFSVNARYFLKEESLKLWQLHIIDILSLSPRDAFFKPISWKVNTGFDREVLKDGEDHLVYRVNPGGGLAFKSDFFGLAYVMLEAGLNFTGAYEDNYALGIGASAGIIKTVADIWKINLSGSGMFYEAGDEHRSIKASMVNSFRISTNNSIDLSLSREDTFDHYRTDVVLNWSLYLE